MKKFSLTKSLARKLGSGARFAVLSIGLMLLVGLSRASEARPFMGEFHGFAEAAPTGTEDPNVVEIVGLLKGTATHLGTFDELLVHRFNVMTLAFTGHTQWTAANGDKLYTTFVGQGYPSDGSPWLAFDVTHTITGGTGRFAGATGTFDGVNGRFNLATGEDLGGYVGTISY